MAYVKGVNISGAHVKMDNLKDSTARLISEPVDFQAILIFSADVIKAARGVIYFFFRTLRIG